jgi:hypothetical protein
MQQHEEVELSALGMGKNSFALHDAFFTIVFYTFYCCGVVVNLLCTCISKVTNVCMSF